MLFADASMDVDGSKDEPSTSSEMDMEEEAKVKVEYKPGIIS